MKVVYQHLFVVLLIMLFKVFLNFKSVEETLVCDQSNESYQEKKLNTNGKPLHPHMWWLGEKQNLQIPVKEDLVCGNTNTNKGLNRLAEFLLPFGL